MVRNVIVGMVAGLVVSGLGLSVASLTLPPPPPRPVAAHSQQVPEAARLAAARQPASTDDVTDDVAVAVPLPAGSEFARSAVEAVPVLPAESALAGAAATTPAAPAAVRGDTGQGGAEPGGPKLGGAGTSRSGDPVTEPPPRPETGAQAPAALAPPNPPEVALEAAPGAEPSMPVPPPGEAVAPDLPPAPDLPRSELAGAKGGANGLEITLMPDGALVPASPALPTVVTQVGGGFADAPGTVVNRLPQVEAGPGPETVAVPAAADPAPEAGPQGHAIESFAAAYVAKPGKPWLSVLLRDVGPRAGGLDRETIKALGPWLTVLIDPAQPDAAQAAADYRAAGFEVAILAAPLPDGAEPKDVEVALDAWRSAVPGALALVEPDPPVLQSETRLREQAEAALADEGMIYVMQPAGVGVLSDTGARLEARIWRELDRRRDKAPVIARTLARAAFEAGRDGAVVVMLSAWPDSIAGLQEWRETEGAGLNLAPLSATVRAQADR